MRLYHCTDNVRNNKIKNLTKKWLNYVVYSCFAVSKVFKFRVSYTLKQLKKKPSWQYAYLMLWLVIRK